MPATRAYQKIVTITETPSSTTQIHLVNTQIYPNDVLTHHLGLKVCVFLVFFFFSQFSSSSCQVPPPQPLKCHLLPLIFTALTPKWIQMTYWHVIWASKYVIFPFLSFFGFFLLPVTWVDFFFSWSIPSCVSDYVISWNNLSYLYIKELYCSIQTEKDLYWAVYSIKLAYETLSFQGFSSEGKEKKGGNSYIMPRFAMALKNKLHQVAGCFADELEFIKTNSWH